MSDSSDMSFMLSLAPMVRCGTLPLRLLSLRMGADLVFTEEYIGYKLAKCHREINTEKNTIDFLDEDNHLIFNTCEEEKSHLILQLGVPNAEIALKAAKLVENDVSGININMGCPREFSIQGKMGAALLKTPDIACDIIKRLNKELKVPVSSKIRLLDGDIKETIDFANKLHESGSDFVAIHLRYRDERDKDPAHYEYSKILYESLKFKIILNGDVFERNDLIKYKELSGGCVNYMIGRGSLKNVCIFNKENKNMSLKEYMKEYIDISMKLQNNMKNCKYVLQEILRQNDYLSKEVGLHVTSAKSYENLLNSLNYFEESDERPLKRIKVE